MDDSLVRPGPTYIKTLYIDGESCISIDYCPTNYIPSDESVYQDFLEHVGKTKQKMTALGIDFNEQSLLQAAQAPLIPKELAASMRPLEELLNARKRPSLLAAFGRWWQRLR
ncbi:hypothetical protein [cf. Phormidesmis sp. LEGE 11477]|uniref:hypothetical protein n=1 Tax=cf. Phormidesmis sp. LEGE 11477 TaxID=1828680 RepID=UPI001D1554B0|nr:hypothetical protein [cf. Phormidesmis sp. LEGE 11477]